jgi:hypothetical protein
VLAKWGEFAASATLVIALSVSAMPLRTNSGRDRLQSEEVALMLYDLKSSFPANTWTVVTDDNSRPQIVGEGFFLPVGGFTDTYDASEVAAEMGDGMTLEIADGLEEWIEEYSATHDDITLYTSLPGLNVYHIDRPPEEDAKVLEQIATEEREGTASQRGGSVRVGRPTTALLCRDRAARDRCPAERAATLGNLNRPN